MSITWGKEWEKRYLAFKDVPLLWRQNNLATAVQGRYSVPMECSGPGGVIFKHSLLQDMDWGWGIRKAKEIGKETKWEKSGKGERRRIHEYLTRKRYIFIPELFTKFFPKKLTYLPEIFAWNLRNKEGILSFFLMFYRTKKLRRIRKNRMHFRVRDIKTGMNFPEIFWFTCLPFYRQVMLNFPFYIDL